MSNTNDIPPATANTVKKPTHTRKSWLLQKQARLLLALAFALILTGSTLLIVTKSQGGPPASTSHKTPTAAPTATHTLPLTPQLLFYDVFLSNTQGWYIGSASGYTRTLENGVLTLSATNHKVLTESLPTSQSFDDFDLSTTFTLVQGDHDDRVGLYLRGDSNLDHDYRIDIGGDNTYAITKESLALNNTPQDTMLVRPTRTHLLHAQGQQNTLRVVMRGPQLILLINSTVVATVSDPDYSHGQIALFVQNSAVSTGVTASFTNITVYTAPTHLPHR